MTQYKYTIIIPHKNIPDLLQRCLDSIPKRDDVQIIIVDDNSNPTIVNFEHFPGLNQTNIEVYFDKSGKGAGKARNIGLDHARGEWVIFLDADDLFSVCANDILEQSLNYEDDILFYNYISVLSNNLSEKGTRTFYNDFFLKYRQNNDETLFRYCFEALWSKIIRRSLIVKHNIKCDEVMYANDVSMSIKLGVLASRVTIIDRPLFIITQREGSLASLVHSASGPSHQECRIRLSVAMHITEFLIDNKIFDKQNILIGALNSYYRFHKKRLIYRLPLICAVHPRLSQCISHTIKQNLYSDLKKLFKKNSVKK